MKNLPWDRAAGRAQGGLFSEVLDEEGMCGPNTIPKGENAAKYKVQSARA